MLQERQQMLVLLWELSNTRSAQPDEATRETLDEFQEILVDYIARCAPSVCISASPKANERRQAWSMSHADLPAHRPLKPTSRGVHEKYDAPRPRSDAKLADDLSLLAENSLPASNWRPVDPRHGRQ